MDAGAYLPDLVPSASFAVTVSLLVATTGLPTVAAATHRAEVRKATSLKTLKIGVLAPLTGPLAPLGSMEVRGWNLYWQQHGNRVDGYTVQLIILDTAGNPAQGLTQARKLVSDGIAMEVGPIAADVGYAVAPYFEAQHIPFFFPASSGNKLTEPNKDPYFLRLAGWTSSQPSFLAGEWACKSAHYKTAVTIGANYSFGWEGIGGFAQVYSDEGCKILKQLWPPVGTTNFSPYISQVSALHPAVVFALEPGADGANFIKQWSELGLKGKIPLVGQEYPTDIASIHGLPATDLIGIISFRHYSEARKDPLNQAFDLAFAKAYGQLPSYQAAAMYTAAQWIVSGIKSVHGNLANKLAFVEALKRISLRDLVMGPMRLDRYGNPIENIYMAKMEPTPPLFRKYSPVWNVVIKTYPNQSQFGPFVPEQFIKQPAYSPSFQGIDYKGTQFARR